MEKLAAEYQDKGFDFVFVFTREAHPGELHPHHTRFEQKLDQARAFQSQLRYQTPHPMLTVWTELRTGHMGPFRTCCTS